MATLDAAPGKQYFKQTADIDMSGQNWTPFNFDGHFDGNGKKISKVKIIQSGKDYVGFFNQLLSDGVLENVHLEDMDVKGQTYVGGLVGQSYGRITNSYATGSVTGTDNVGGLVGRSSGSITNSYATGSVTGTGNVGGLVGHFSTSSITNSYATGSVTGTGNVGGLVGLASGSIITNNYATGSVTGYGVAGGLVGHSSGSHIRNSYATGSVTGSWVVGGLVGDSNVGTITYSYYDTNTTGRSDNDGRGLPRTTSEMKEGTPTASTVPTPIYVNWDTTIWNFGTTTDYPTLR